MLAMGPRDLNSAPYSPVHCSSHSMTSFQSSELTELPVVENSQLFAQRTVRPPSVNFILSHSKSFGEGAWGRNGVQRGRGAQCQKHILLHLPADYSPPPPLHALSRDRAIAYGPGGRGVHLGPCPASPPRPPKSQKRPSEKKMKFTEEARDWRPSLGAHTCCRPLTPSEGGGVATKQWAARNRTQPGGTPPQTQGSALHQKHPPANPLNLHAPPPPPPAPGQCACLLSLPSFNFLLVLRALCCVLLCAWSWRLRCVQLKTAAGRRGRGAWGRGAWGSPRPCGMSLTPGGQACQAGTPTERCS